MENSVVDDFVPTGDICHEDNNNTDTVTLEELTPNAESCSHDAVSSVSEISISDLRSLLPQVEYPKIESLFRRYHWTMFIILIAWSIPFGQSAGMEIALKCLISLVLAVMAFSATQETLQNFIIAMFYRNIIFWLDSQSSDLLKSPLNKVENSHHSHESQPSTDSVSENIVTENSGLTTEGQHLLIKIAQSPKTVQMLKTLIKNSKEAKTKIGRFKVALKMVKLLWDLRKMIPGKGTGPH